jgi:hypothetical protein
VCSSKGFTSLATRQQRYREVLSEVKSNRMSVDSLIAFIKDEPHPALITVAVRDYLRLHPCEVGEEMAPVSRLCGFLKDPSTLNRGAVLAGLVLLGDRRVNTVLRTFRRDFNPAEIRSFSRVHGVAIKAETVIFYLDWLTELAGHDTPHCVIADLCCGLMLMIVHDEYRLVEELEDSVGFSGSETRRVPFAAFLTKTMPLFHSLVDRLPGSQMQQVMRLWNRHREIRYQTARV